MPASLAEEWPAFRHDQRRSGVSSESLSPANFRMKWQWQSVLPPAPAWPDSAKWDAYAKLSGLRSMRDYDPVFHPIASETHVYFGSNADDTLRCIDLATGQIAWKFTAGAPIRVAPTLFNGNIYFGSDDGSVYSLDADSGAENWRVELQPNTRYFVNDGRLCSMQPVRTGVLIDDQRELAVAGSGIFPWKSASLFGLDLETGKIAWERELGEGWTLEGSMLLSDQNIIAPQGRSPPQLFQREDGKPEGAVAGGGGSFVLLTDEQRLLHGPGNKGGWITESSTSDRQKIASFEGGSSVVVQGDIAYLMTPTGLSAVHRKTQQKFWEISLERPQEVIASKGNLWIGGDHYVAAINAETGDLQWASEVLGRAIGLCIANQHLVVSTDQGQVLCFSADGQLTSGDTGPEEPSVTLPDSLISLIAHAQVPVEIVNPTSPADSSETSESGEDAPDPDEEENSEKKEPEPKPTDPRPQGEASFVAATGPEIRFVSPEHAEIQWTTNRAMECTVELVSGRATAESTQPSNTKTKEHRWMLAGIQRNELVEFRIVTTDGKSSHVFQCDGHFDYTRKDLRESLKQQSTDSANLLASRLFDAVPIDQSRGIGVVSTPNSHQLTPTAVAAASGFDVIALAQDDKHASKQKEQTLASGVYGRPICIHPRQQLDRFPGGFANFVYYWPSTTDVENATARSLCRILKPGGFLIAPEEESTTHSLLSQGLKVIKEISIENQSYNLWKRAPSAGSAGWTHMYGNADNTAFAGESLQDADSIEDLEITWCGRPGPRYQSDRGNRKPSPLASGGRLYLQGLYRLIGMDAHNGTILWSHELPEVVRFNVPRDCSNWCADEKALYVATRDRCKVIDGATGKMLADIPVWNPTNRDMSWGFVARQGELLIGSCVQNDAHFTEFWGGEFWYDAKDGELAKKVCSDALFAQDPSKKDLTWSYHSGLIVNPTICVNEDQIVFVECRSSSLIDGATRRMDGDEFWSNLHVVSLNTKTGEKLWETPAKPLPGVSAFYGVLAADRYLIQTSNDGDFALYSLGLDDGKILWRGMYKWEANHHGKHLSRPAVVEDRIYLRPFTIALNSGKVLANQFPTGHQCGTYTASKNALFLRAGSLAMWDGKSTAATRFNRVRPDCWISTIPAEGMLLSPEGGGGCSCGGWIETSMGFAPK